MPRLASDVCVIGGGPAGAVISTLLARLGHDVLLIDRSASTRSVIESLTPAVRLLLDSIGIHVRGGAAGRPVRTSLVRWSDALPHVVAFPDDAAPLLVDRARFDGALRRAAIGAGAQLMCPAHATRVRRHAADWEVTITDAARERAVRSRFLVDASGRSSRFGGSRESRLPRVVALHGIWPDARMFDHDMMLDRSRLGWCWGSVMPGERGAQAIVFVPADRLRRVVTGDRHALYRQVIASMPLAAALTSGSALGSLRVREASVSAAAPAIEEHFIRIGDASATVDPLSSAGVQRAIQSAIGGSVAAHTILTRPTATAAALREYRLAQRRSARRHLAAAVAFYAAPSFCIDDIA
jgi:flavin-dependent dehydrogenase